MIGRSPNNADGDQILFNLIQYGLVDGQRSVAFAVSRMLPFYAAAREGYAWRRKGKMVIAMH